MAQPILNGDYYVDNQDLGYATINEIFNRAAHAAIPVIIDKTLTTPPGGETNGECYIPVATAAGDWAGHENELAMYYDGWLFRDIAVGEIFYDLNTTTLHLKTAATPTYVDIDTTP